MNIGALILAGGSGKRLGGTENKAFAIVLGKTMIERCAKPFLECGIKEIVIVCKSADEKQIRDILKSAYEGVQFKYAKGGSERQQSCENGLKALSEDITHVLIHDCARMLVTPAEIKRCMDALKKDDAVIEAVPLKDTIKRVEEGVVTQTPNRNDYVLVQTPQCFSLPLIKAAHEYANKTAFLATDDAGLVEHMGGQVKFIQGSYENIKITTKDDIIVAETILRKRGQAMNHPQPFRIGNGFDVHQLTKGRKLILGGVQIEHDKGLLGHSDADVLVHSIMDAVLGAAALGDIGVHFPDSDDTYKNADSIELLKKVAALIKEKQFAIGNIDSVVMAQKPKLQPYISAMRENITAALEIPLDLVNIKATTTEHLSFIGREEGIASSATALLYKID